MVAIPTDSTVFAFFEARLPGEVHCYWCFVDHQETAQKLLQIAFQHRQTLLWSGLTVAFVVCKRANAAPISPPHAYYFMLDMICAVFWDASAIFAASARGSSKTDLFLTLRCKRRSNYFKLRLNTVKHCFEVVSRLHLLSARVQTRYPSCSQFSDAQYFM